MYSLKTDKNNSNESKSIASEEHLRFESLLSLLSAKLVNLSVELADFEKVKSEIV